MKIAALAFSASLLLIAGCAHKSSQTASVPVYTQSVTSTPAPGSAPIIATPPSPSGNPPSGTASVTPPGVSTYPPTGRTTETAPAGSTMPGEVFNLHVQGLTPQDRTLAQQVMDGLRADNSLNALFPKVDINIAQGKVVLSGIVANRQQHQAVLNAVKRSAGENNVVDQLQVQPE